MINIMRGVVIVVCFLLIAGCVEHEAATNGYYSTGSGVTTYNPATVGYNRNYQPPGRAPQSGYNGYSSTGRGTSRMYQESNAAPQGASGGWSSSGSG